MKLLLILIYSLFLIKASFAASCCGGSASASSIITNDQKAQMSLNTSSIKFTDYVDSNSVWSKFNDFNSQVISLSGSHILYDRYQIGLASSFVSRSDSINNNQGIGDTILTAGYEYLTDWDYSLYKPSAVGYLEITIPTANSIHDNGQNNGLTNALGRGFWAISLGSIFSKNINQFDLYSQIFSRFYFSESRSINNQAVRLKPGLSSFSSLGLGYNLNDWRLGAEASLNYETGTTSKGAINSKGSLQRFFNVNFNISYLMQKNLSLILSYSDQSLLGSPSNASLSQSIALNIQKRWDR